MTPHSQTVISAAPDDANPQEGFLVKIMLADRAVTPHYSFDSDAAGHLYMPVLALESGAIFA